MTPAATDDDFTTFDRIWSGLKSACQPTKELGRYGSRTNFPSHLRFGTDGNAVSFQLFGWNHAEPGYTWTEGREAYLELPAETSGTNYFLNARIAPLTGPSVTLQRVRVRVGSTEVAHWQVDQAGHYFAFLPAYLRASSQELCFCCDDAKSPHSLGLSGDDRELAIQFFELWLSPWTTVSF